LPRGSNAVEDPEVKNNVEGCTDIKLGDLGTISDAGNERHDGMFQGY